MKKIVIVSILFLSGVLLTGCSFRDTWQGFYYPDGCLACSDKYIFSPIFNDKESCLNWAEDLKEKKGKPDDLYECGKNCKPPKTPDGFYLCKETVD